MAFIKFNNKKSPVEAQAKKLDNHRIEITGCAVNTSGFLYYQDKEMRRLYGDYSEFTILYQELDEGFILSDVVYPEPVEPEPSEEPTLKEEVKILKDAVKELQTDMQSINNAMGE